MNAVTEDIFSQVKDILEITCVLEYYGIEINNKGFALCPFHQEKTPSFKVYDDSFHCFGCGESGTVIDFAIKYFKLSNIEAVKKLNEDFRLNLSVERRFAPAAQPMTYENKNLIEKFKVWEKRAFIAVSGYFRALKFWGEQIFVNKIEYFNQYLPEVENIVFVETLLDMMMDNTHDFAAQIEFYKKYGKEVAKIEQRYNEINQ